MLPFCVFFFGFSYISELPRNALLLIKKRYLPDTVGHAGYSEETRLKPATFQYGEWAADVIDGLRLEKPIVLGGSYGAGILLNLAAYAPQKIRKAILVVPSGFARPPVLPLIARIGFPMIMFRFTQKRTWVVGSSHFLPPNLWDALCERIDQFIQQGKLEGELGGYSATRAESFYRS